MDKKKAYSWHKIADSIAELAFSANGLLELEVDSKKICVSMQNGQLRGCAAKCPHASGSLAEGYVDALGNIVCPVHRYKFSLQNGRNVSGEGYFIKIYPIESRENGIFVGIEGAASIDSLK